MTVAHLTHLLLQRNRPTIAVPTAFVTVALSPTCHHKLNPNFALTGKKDGPSDSCTNRGPQSHYSTFPHLGTQLQSSIELSQPCQLFVYTPKAPTVYSARKSCCPLCNETSRCQLHRNTSPPTRPQFIRRSELLTPYPLVWHQCFLNELEHPNAKFQSASIIPVPL